MSEEKTEKKERFIEYSNSAEVGISRFDLSVKFFRMSSTEQKELGEIILSPVHAKVLLNVLAENVKTYEELFGKIELTEPSSEKINAVQQPQKEN